jgi:molybdenum cofactor cytidylyltransferase
MPDFRCAAVILAAGASTRLGQPKQLILLDRESLLRRTTRLAVEAGCSPVAVVLGFEAVRMLPEVECLPVEVVTNSEWQEGMGSSLRCGMTALCQTEPQPNGVLVLVCDQPRLSSEHLRELLVRHQSANAGTRGTGITITASFYAQRAGVPAVFSASLFPGLLASAGDQGARNLIRAHAAGLQSIPWPEGELDLDRPEDLKPGEAGL